MQPTGRYWESIAIGGGLAALALLLDRPGLLVGTGGILAWLLGAQLAFTRAITRLDDIHRINQGLDRRAVFVDDPATVTLSAAGQAPGLDVTVQARPSPALTVEGSTTVTLPDAATDTGTTTFTVTSPIAGTHRLNAPELEVRDRFGLFTERFRRGSSIELTVEAREPRRLHVGEGGRALPIAFGEHPVEATGSGIIPAELREYQAGEAASRIDWKTTARLRTPHVREYQVESDVVTLFVIDHRAALDIGPSGETAFAYLRAAALGYLTVAESLHDPIGCYSLDGDGVHRLQSPTSTPNGYRRTRQQLRAIQPTSGDVAHRPFAPLRYRGPVAAPETRFGRTVRAYRGMYPTRLTDTATLQHAVRTALSEQDGTAQLVLFTDDSDRAAIRAAVSETQRVDARLSVFIAPRVLFEPGTFADLSEAIGRYEAFERFRASLSQQDGVTAYEVAPQDRLQTVLTGVAQRSQSRHTQRSRN